MTFKDIILKNFIYSIRKYLAFFLCSTFTIAIFFIFVNLSYQKEVNEFLSGTAMGSQYIFSIMIGCLFLFSIGFMTYISMSKTKGRSKEFGLYMTMGMSQRDISKLIIIEDTVLTGVSIITGTILGTVFSRLVYLITIRIVGIEDIQFSLHFKSFGITAGGFFLIYLVSLITTIGYCRKLKIRELITADRKSEYNSEGNKFVVFIGIILTLILPVIAAISTQSRDFALNNKIVLPSIILSIIGVFLLISNIVSLMSRQIQKNKRLYTRELLNISELKYVSKKNRTILFILSVLCMTILFSSAPTFALLNMSDDIADQQKGPDFCYIKGLGVNNFERGSVERRLEQDGVKIKSSSYFDCIFVNRFNGEIKNDLPLCMLTISQAQNMFNEKISVNDGEFKIVIPDPLLKLDEMNEEVFKIWDGKSVSNSVQLKNSGLIINNKFFHRLLTRKGYFMVVTDNTYKSIESKGLALDRGVIHYLMLDDWRKSKNVYNELVKENGSNPMSNYLGVTGKYDNYTTCVKLYSIFIFVFNFMSILFFAASILILLFKQYENIDKMARKYMQLRKIGITKAEFKKFVNSQSRFVFFIPIIFGFFMGSCLMLIMQSLMGGGGMDLYAAFWKASIKVMIVYLVFQILFYKVVTQAYYRRILTEASIN